jgi:hypothetical protein
VLYMTEGTMTKSPSQSNLRDTKRLMAALGRMPPKPHEEMKLGKTKGKAAKSPIKERLSKDKNRSDHSK